jgi:hypothetical protein
VVGDAWDLPAVLVIRRNEWLGDRTMTSVAGDSRSAALDGSTLRRCRTHSSGRQDDRRNGMGSRRVLLRRLIGNIVRVRLQVRIDTKELP